VADRNQSEHSKRKIVDRLIEFVVTPFYRLNISRKLMLGYSVLLLLLVGISVFTMYNLNRLNDVIIAQERYFQRYLILKSPDDLNEFWNKQKEFNRLTEQLRALPGHKAYPVDQIVRLQTEYKYILSEAIGWIEDPDSPISKAFEKNIKLQQEKINAVIEVMESRGKQVQKQKTAKTATIGRIARGDFMRPGPAVLADSGFCHHPQHCRGNKKIKARHRHDLRWQI
jgi:CHASE3 domain sensor protein